MPLLYEDFGLDEEGRAAFGAYLGELEDWLAGILNWHRNVRRYRAEDVRSGAGTPLLRHGPKGLGTSAARVVELLGSASR
ncbi:hypothetical protein [Streptomyces sp. NPDC006324]|uniref:hypothetical protein n=1 Tax=Streptomyces sp. NPDC006324 TaxID=3156751 RepID=UPI0033AE03E1